LATFTIFNCSIGSSAQTPSCSQCIDRNGCLFSEENVCLAPNDLLGNLGVKSCPLPKIRNISPGNGPVNGGTEISITGTNLGTDRSEVKISLTDPDNVDEDPLDCLIKDYKKQNIEFETIICETPAVPKPKNYLIKIELIKGLNKGGIPFLSTILNIRHIEFLKKLKKTLIYSK
jgi:hypothetical protein